MAPKILLPGHTLSILFKLIFYNLLGQFSEIKKASFSGNISDLTNPDKLIIVLVGHATVFINFYGTTILTDPVFGGYFPGFARFVEPGLKIDQLPFLDYVLISHAHFDHLNRKSLRQLSTKTKTLVIPKNDLDLVSDLGFSKIVELDWKMDLKETNLAITAFKPTHWGSRYPWERIQRGYNSYILTKRNTTILFAGDTAYNDNFKKIARKHPIDVALLPIGAYDPPFFQRFHLSPHDAIKVFEEIEAKYFIPIHWGAFRLSLEGLEEPPGVLRHLMRGKGLQDNLKLLYPGQHFERPYPQ